MKKIFLMMLAALPVMLSSCSSDDNLPDVTMSVTYSGATYVDDVMYVVQGDTLSIDAITATPVNTAQKATIGATAYYWNYQYLGTTITEPFGLSFDTATMAPGDYLLQINTTVYQVDHSVGISHFTFPVKIVEDASQIPGKGARTGGTITPDANIRAGASPAS